MKENARIKVMADSFQTAIYYIICTNGEYSHLVPLSEKYNHNKQLAGAELIFPHKSNQQEEFGSWIQAAGTIEKESKCTLTTDCRGMMIMALIFMVLPNFFETMVLSRDTPALFVRQEIGLDNGKMPNWELYVTWLEEFHG